MEFYKDRMVDSVLLERILLSRCIPWPLPLRQPLPPPTPCLEPTGRKNKADPAPAPPAQRARMQKMFASAAAKPRAGSRPASHDAAATEALLEDILGGVAAAGCSPSAASPARRARYPGTTSLSLAAAAKVPARSVRGLMARPLKGWLHIPTPCLPTPPPAVAGLCALL